MFDAHRGFLIEVCRPGIEGSSLPLDKIDWKQFSDMAEREGLGGFVYILLKEEKMVPLDSLDSFKDDYHTNVRTNLSCFHSLNPVVECLEGNGITSIVFRGASLMGDVYPTFGMRGFKDVDILIREGDLFKAIDLLKKEGFCSCDPYISVLYNKNICIDLHTDFMTYSRVKPVRLAINTDIDSVFERTRIKEVQGTRLRTLHPEDALLSLAVHLQMHSFDRL
ncbi:MAG: nucleotidyltransferase family protein, partial [Deltaproteobacteria bacterium]|nr:nucleotidyltransferase family protein [Deltaproteobacteria bacterium]